MNEAQKAAIAKARESAKKITVGVSEKPNMMLVGKGEGIPIIVGRLFPGKQAAQGKKLGGPSSRYVMYIGKDPVYVKWMPEKKKPGPADVMNSDFEIMPNVQRTL